MYKEKTKTIHKSCNAISLAPENHAPKFMPKLQVSLKSSTIQNNDHIDMATNIKFDALPNFGVYRASIIAIVISKISSNSSANDVGIWKLMFLNWINQLIMIRNQKKNNFHLNAMYITRIIAGDKHTIEKAFNPVFVSSYNESKNRRKRTITLPPFSREYVAILLIIYFA